MPKTRFLFLSLLCLALLVGTGCQRKGIPCPKPTKSKVKIQGKNSGGLEGINVQMDKNGLVKKKKIR